MEEIKSFADEAMEIENEAVKKLKERMSTDKEKITGELELPELRTIFIDLQKQLTQIRSSEAARKELPFYRKIYDDLGSKVTQMQQDDKLQEFCSEELVESEDFQMVPEDLNQLSVLIEKNIKEGLVTEDAKLYYAHMFKDIPFNGEVMPAEYFADITGVSVEEVERAFSIMDEEKSNVKIEMSKLVENAVRDGITLGDVKNATIEKEKDTRENGERNDG